MSTSTAAATKSPTAIEGFLRSTLYLPDLQARRKTSVLEELVQPLVPAGVTRHPAAILDLLAQREALGSTAIGKGIAVPHARSALIAERAVLVARSVRGIDFDAPDGRAVQLFFLIVAPSAGQDPIYLNLLADIVRAVRLTKVRQRLLEAPDFSAVQEALYHAAAE
ncbi:MAG TPA: PTS sugar transporter subunit IIA [Candidatus Eisenbacteria bacterium]|nr:PTS sugar transporter subunit IIA [Candidatus Eisenbacteria bacterium]